jgi:glycosyltransferase involved in cell wall biosynthesis
VRLVHLAGYGGPYAGSFIPMLRAVMAAGRRRGWSCEAVFGPAARDQGWLAELGQDGILVRLAPSGSRADVSATVSALLAENDSSTILHTHFTAFDIPCARHASRRTATAVFWHVHTPHGGSLRLRARNRVKYTVFGRRVDQILCVSAELADLVVARGAPRNRVVYVPNAIDAERFRLAAQGEREEARRALGLRPGQEVLVHFGWDWDRKGGDLFCAAVARLREAGRDVVGITVGGRDKAGPAVRTVSPREDVRTFYAAANVFMSPSRAEGTPYSVLEAILTGTAVVASDIPGHRDVSAPACVLAPLDAGALAAAAAAMLDRPPALGESDARTGHDWVRSNRGLPAWTAALMKRYESVTGVGA